jgi:pSer/pThr/pTyr-binding forkhead associated (FHA) protein
MARLVVLSEGLSGRSYELKAEKTTVGRVDDNAFQIPDASVSSHHCEITLRGNEVLVKDLNSTNGTFITGQQITEAVLKPGQTMRLGQVEVRLESGEGAPSKKMLDTAKATQRGVKLEDLDQTAKITTFDKASPFAKKTNKATKIFIIGAVVLGAIILCLLVVILMRFGNLGP